MSHEYDVVVVGAGNAALSAAHAAAANGASVRILEKAPKEDRGGNSTLTGHLRFAYDDLDSVYAVMRPDTVTQEIRTRFESRIPRKTRQDLWDEVMQATGGLSDPDMLRTHVEHSYETVAWLHSLGHNWVPSTTEPTADGNLVRLDGGGMALQQRNFDLLEANPKVVVSYSTSATELLQDKRGAIIGVKALTAGGFEEIYSRSVVLACGGFEANPEMRARYLGPGWDSAYIRGVPFNTGDGLRMALDIGALPYGNWSSAHAAPNDWQMPPFTTPSMRRADHRRWSRYLFPFSISVNTAGLRFHDEATGTRDFTYAKAGRAILTQPGGKAFQIIDAKVRDMGIIPTPYDYAKIFKADTIEDLAKITGIDPAGLVQTIKQYNDAVPTDRAAQPSSFIPDGVGTVGLTPPKSNFAMRIDAPPYEAFVVRAGLTFTFGGLRIDPTTAQVQHTSGNPIRGLYAAGEIMGGLWYWNYPSGSGMMAGATFGRIAGNAASQRS